MVVLKENLIDSLLTSAFVHFSLLVAWEATLSSFESHLLSWSYRIHFSQVYPWGCFSTYHLQDPLCQHLIPVSTEIEVTSIYKGSKRAVLWAGIPGLEYIIGRKQKQEDSSLFHGQEKNDDHGGTISKVLSFKRRGLLVVGLIPVAVVMVQISCQLSLNCLRLT